jgi:hypothetical protein
MLGMQVCKGVLAVKPWIIDIRTNIGKLCAMHVSLRLIRLAGKQPPLNRPWVWLVTSRRASGDVNLRGIHRDREAPVG